MKKIIINVGKALLYFGAYIGMQLLVYFIASIIISSSFTSKMMSDEGELDFELLVEQTTNVLNENVLLLTMISGVLAILIFCLVILIKKKNILQEMFFTKFKLINIIPLVILGIALNIFISLLFSIIPFPENWLNSYQSSSEFLSLGNSIIAIIAVVIVAPIVEELTFRVFMYTRLKRIMPKVLAAIIVSLIFAIVHGTIIWGIYTFAFGLILTWVFERFHSAIANIAIHVSFNALSMALMGIEEIPDIVGWILLALSTILIAVSVIWIYKSTVSGKNDVNAKNSKQVAYSYNYDI